MNRLTFRRFFEATDIFGFEREQRDDGSDDSLLTQPIKQFDIELMLDFLSKKKIGTFYGESTFPNVIQWGNQPGSVRLEVDPGYRFSVKKLGTDKIGYPRWVTKKLFQLNRNGYGGFEDSVSQEIFEYLNHAANDMIAAPTEDYKDLENLTTNIYHKLKRTAKEIFIPEGVKKLHDDAYIIKFGVRGHGLETRDQQRVEQNQTYLLYDREQGTIRVFNQNLLSKVGGPHEFAPSKPSFEHYFFPTQDRDEISETIAVFMKYY
jgi:hypothetical protein